MEDPTLSTFSFSTITPFEDNPSLEIITQASQMNNAIHYPERLSLQLNQNVFHKQTLILEEKLSELNA